MVISITGAVGIPSGSGALSFKTVLPDPGFAPPQSADLVLHIDSSETDSLTLVGSDIHQIDDLSGNGRNFTGNVVSLVGGGGASDHPTIVSASINGRDTMLFNGSNAILTWSGASTLIKHAFIVARSYENPFTDFRGLFTSGNVVNQIVLTGVNGANSWTTHFDNTTYYEGLTNRNPPESTIGSWQVHSISSPTGITASEWVIGHDRKFAARGWFGEIAHVIAYDVVLGSSARDQLITDLLSRWGI